jgi:sensor domain CHASE-containing protein
MSLVVSFIVGGVLCVAAVAIVIYLKNKKKADELLKAKVKEQLDKVQSNL